MKLFRALGTLEGTRTLLTRGEDIAAQAREHAAARVSEQVTPGAAWRFSRSEDRFGAPALCQLIGYNLLIVTEMLALRVAFTMVRNW